MAGNSDMALLEVVNIKKDFNGILALEKVNLRLDAGNLLCLLGPSGCGKTTLLRIIAGLEKTDSGTVILDGQDLSRMPPHRRGFGMMFQDFSLFPHKNVFDNVAFALQLEKHSRERINHRVKEMLHLVGLEGSIVDINRYVRSNLIVVDGIIGHEGMGPTSGDPVRMDMIIAGDKTASVDSMCARIMGVDPFSVKYLVMAAYAGLGEVYTRKIRVKGEKIRDVRREFKSAIDALNGGKYDKINIKSY